MATHQLTLPFPRFIDTSGLNKPKLIPIGTRCGRLVILEETRLQNRVAYICQCDCGKKLVTRATAIRNGRTSSCGCYRIESARSLRKGKGRPVVIGENFGRWTVVDIEPDRDKARMARCVCECGTSRQVNVGNLFKGISTSCGCTMPAILRARNAAMATHKLSKTPTWVSWMSMRRRCLVADDKDWPNYGGRGITIIDRWMDFSNFFADMGQRPDGTTLDRIDVNGNYEPGNCRWATDIQQGRNQRTTRLSEAKAEQIRQLVDDGGGRRGTTAKVAKMFGLSSGHVSAVVSGKLWSTGGCPRVDDPTHVSWRSMLDRCRHAPTYISRGISVSERWLNYQNFLFDMGHRPAGMTIDRIDNSAGYCPGNCRWATPKEQANNRG